MVQGDFHLLYHSLMRRLRGGLHQDSQDQVGFFLQYHVLVNMQYPFPGHPAVPPPSHPAVPIPVIRQYHFPVIRHYHYPVIRQYLSLVKGLFAQVPPGVSIQWWGNPRLPYMPGYGFHAGWNYGAASPALTQNVPDQNAGLMKQQEIRPEEGQARPTPRSLSFAAPPVALQPEPLYQQWTYHEYFAEPNPVPRYTHALSLLCKAQVAVPTTPQLQGQARMNRRLGKFPQCVETLGDA